MDPLMGGIVAGIAVIFVLILVVSNASAEKAKEKQEEQRRAFICSKYGSTEIAERIISRTVWVGETAEQLRDSFGPPLDIDEKVLKTKKKEIWKYVRKGANRYGLKFTVENDVVVGWDEKL